MIIYALANPESRFGAWVGTWVQITRKVLEPAYVLAGRASCGDAEVSDVVARAWIFDVHLIAINLIVVAALFAASRRYWATWLQAFYDGPGWENANPETKRQEAEAGFGTLLWGAIAGIWWLILENDLFGSAAHCASLRPWLLFREPLLTTFAHGAASFAAALSLARKPYSGSQ
ncbi:MAG: hypothetical protein ACXWVJ_03625 [Caulobacteraceae bacterium]